MERVHLQSAAVFLLTLNVSLSLSLSTWDWLPAWPAALSGNEPATCYSPGGWLLTQKHTETQAKSKKGVTATVFVNPMQ